LTATENKRRLEVYSKTVTMVVTGMMNDDKASSKFGMAEEQPSFK
jgi:hypothetical protein